MEPNTGGGDPCGIGRHRLGDLAPAAAGLSMSNLLRLQVLSGQEEKARPSYNLKAPAHTFGPCETAQP